MRLSDADRRAAKARVVSGLAERLADNPDWQAFVAREAAGRTFRHDYNPSEGIVDREVKRWSKTSSDHDPVMLATQRAVRDEFGLAETYDPEPEQSRAKTDETAQQDGRALRALVRAQYEWTQSELAAQGIDTVTVFRGAGVLKRVAPPGVRLSTATVQLQPASSFSATYGVAKYFAENAHDQVGDSAVFVARIPRQAVLATAKTGYGCLTEGELLVLGGTHPVVALPRSEYKSLRKTTEAVEAVRQYAATIA